MGRETTSSLKSWSRVDLERGDYCYDSILYFIGYR